jgi:hypothetical protein
MSIVITIVLAAVLAAGTMLYGWWTVPVLAFLWGLASLGRVRRAAGLAALAAVLAWGALLALDGMSGHLVGLGALFGRVARQPPAVFFVLSLVFPALLAWSAAALGASVWPGPRRRAYYVPSSTVLRGDRARPDDEVPAHG